MSYTNIESCLSDLEKHGRLIRIREEINPDLEAAAIQLRIFELSGKAVLFENIKGSRYRAACNIFGTMERCEFIFRETLSFVKKAIELRKNPVRAIKHPFQNAKTGLAISKALPKKVQENNIRQFGEISISDLPQIRHWQKDGGAFITLPQVYSEDLNQPGIMHSNLGMYRIQLSGNEYISDKEIGLHYQIHRGIGIHQSIAKERNQPLKVSIFVGGPPAHTLAAVMPLPEGLSELTFAGMLAGRRFRYFYHDGYCISADADFVITGEIYPDETKPEGPFGDHLGYYSLRHAFPVMHVHKVFAKPKGIWPFTVVGRPPQEDTLFGKLIHEIITGDAIEQEIPGLKAVHAVDTAGVHPLLLATGSERYTPYANDKQPAELLTLANRILGTGQLSLAKYLWITAGKDVPDINDVASFLKYILERIDWRRDVHFQTCTTIDTLDYSGESLNHGSKVILAAYGEKKRTIAGSLPNFLYDYEGLNAQLAFAGVAAIQLQPFTDYESAEKEISALTNVLKNYTDELKGIPLIVICDDAGFMAKELSNFLWVTFTRSNPSHDIYGINSFVKNKHWSCETSLIIDARIKPHHAPILERNADVDRIAEEILSKYL